MGAMGIKTVVGTAAGPGTAGIGAGTTMAEAVGMAVAAGMGTEAGPVLSKERSCMAAETESGPAWADAWSAAPEVGAIATGIGLPSSIAHLNSSSQSLGCTGWPTDELTCSEELSGNRLSLKKWKTSWAQGVLESSY